MAQLRDKHRAFIYDHNANEIDPAQFDIGARIRGFSSPRNKPNRRPLEFEVTLNDDGDKQFTRRKSPWWKFW